VLRRLDVLSRESGHAGLGEDLDARRRGGFHRSSGGGTQRLRLVTTGGLAFFLRLDGNMSL
jgi:hypothetical protein